MMIRDHAKTAVGEPLSDVEQRVALEAMDRAERLAAEIAARSPGAERIPPSWALLAEVREQRDRERR